MWQVLTFHNFSQKSTLKWGSSENGAPLCQEIELFLNKVRTRMHEVIKVWDDFGLFSWKPPLGEDFYLTSVFFWDPTSNKLRYPDSAQMASSNANFGIPPTTRGIMSSDRQIRLDDSFFAHLKNRNDITPDQWKFFLLLGIGYLWYAGPHGKLRELRNVEDVSDWFRRMRGDISALDDFALWSMRLIEGNSTSLWNPFSYIKTQFWWDQDLIFPLKDRMARFDTACHLIQ